MRESHSCYEFEILNFPGFKYYYYKIYGDGCFPYDDGIIESSNSYRSEQAARVGAISHISRLENGER